MYSLEIYGGWQLISNLVIIKKFDELYRRVDLSILMVQFQL